MIRNCYLSDLIPLDATGVKLTPGMRVAYKFPGADGDPSEFLPIGGIGMIVAIIRDRASVMWSVEPNEDQARRNAKVELLLAKLSKEIRDEIDQEIIDHWDDLVTQ